MTFLTLNSLLLQYKILSFLIYSLIIVYIKGILTQTQIRSKNTRRKPMSIQHLIKLSNIYIDSSLIKN